MYIRLSELLAVETVAAAIDSVSSVEHNSRNCELRNNI